MKEIKTTEDTCSVKTLLYNKVFFAKKTPVINAREAKFQRHLKTRVLSSNINDVGYRVMSIKSCLIIFLSTKVLTRGHSCTKN